MFGHERGDLSAGIFEAHSQTHTIDFSDCPASFRDDVKRYIWELINHPAPQHMQSAGTDRLALATIRTSYRVLLTFIVWLDSGGINQFGRITTADLDTFLDVHRRNQ